MPISKRVSMGAKWNGLGSVRNYVDTYSCSLFFVRFHSFHTILENKNCRLHRDSNSNCPPRSQVHDPGQCDQIFWKFWPKKFLTKVAQTFGNCLAFFENITFYVKIWCRNFEGIFLFQHLATLDGPGLQYLFKKPQMTLCLYFRTRGCVAKLLRGCKQRNQRRRRFRELKMAPI